MKLGWLDIKKVFKRNKETRLEAELKIKLETEVASKTKELKDRTDEMEAFTYSVSHDLRGPLRSIHGFCSIIVDKYGGKIDEDFDRHFGMIIASAEKMARLIDDLLKFSRLTQKDLDISPVDLTALVIECVEEIKIQYPKKKYEVRIGDLGVAKIDYAAFKQVFLNLLDNSFKFSAKRKLPVIVIDKERKAGKTVYFIEDNGIGFDMKYYGKIFKVFDRLHTADEFPGTGIGTSIIKRVIEKHGGKVWADSAINAGARFSFILDNDN